MSSISFYSIFYCFCWREALLSRNNKCTFYMNSCDLYWARPNAFNNKCEVFFVGNTSSSPILRMWSSLCTINIANKHWCCCQQRVNNQWCYQGTNHNRLIPDWWYHEGGRWTRLSSERWRVAWHRGRARSTIGTLVCVTSEIGAWISPGQPDLHRLRNNWSRCD